MFYFFIVEIIFIDLRRFFLFIKECFTEDSDSYILWLPVFFAVGVLLQFYFYNEFIIASFLSLISCLLIFIISKSPYRAMILFPFIFIFFGYLRTHQYIKNNDHYIIKEPLGYVKVYGKVKEQIIRKNYNEQIINEIVIETIRIGDKYVNTLLKVRLNDKNAKVYKSDIIVNTVAFPIKNNYMGFNSERYYYFKHIGGLGYKGKIIYNKTIDEKQTITEKINDIRTEVAKRIIDARPETAATGIIAILITGKKDMADKKAIEYMNYSGLAHLLSISGLHMMTLIGIVFFIAKWVLLRFEFIALNYNVFKISAIISLFINFLYLLLSGSSVSAVRAYLMSVILLVSIIVGKFNSSLRSVMFVAFLVLLIKPHLIFSAAFQMSFMAVIALIACVDIVYNKEKFGKTFLTIGLLTSFIAECATTPFSIYNFNNYSFYNVFINSFVTPLVSFVILPFSLLSMFLYPFNLEKILLIPASYLMDFVLFIAKYITEIPNSVFFVASPNIFSMFLMILGLLWFCLWHEKWRYYGIIMYIFAIIIYLFQPKPSTIKTEKSLILIENNKAFIYTDNKYEIFSITRKLGIDEYYILKNDFKNCDKNSCLRVFNNKDKFIIIKNGKINIIKKEEIVEY